MKKKWYNKLKNKVFCIKKRSEYMAKTYTVDVTTLQKKNTFDLKEVDILQIGTTHEAEAYKSVKVSGSTLTLEMFTGPDHTPTRAYATLIFKNCESVEKLYYSKTLFNEGGEFDTEHNWLVPDVIDAINNVQINEAKKTASYTGTKLLDIFNVNGTETAETTDGREFKYTIKASEGKNYISLTNAFNSNTISSGAFDDEISLTNTSNAELFKKAVTKVTAGNGENRISITGSGNNDITTGKDNDRFVINESSALSTIKAGAGENTFTVKNNNFGNITIKEEKVNAENIIIFENDITGYILSKDKNNLIIANHDGSSININDYFANNKKGALTTINGYDNLGDLMETNDIQLLVTGSGTLKGTEFDDIVVTEDLPTDEYIVKPKNDKIYAGKGDDFINAGAGKNSIYVYKGDGSEIIEDGGGVDTLIFQKGTSIGFGFIKNNDEPTEDGDVYDLKIYYSSDENDNITLYGAVSSHDGETFKLNENQVSVETLKIGSKSYKLKSLLERNVIKGTNGTIGNDDIWVPHNKKGNVTIVGDAGSDRIYIGSNDDSVGGNNGNNIDNSNNYNIDPARYKNDNFAPTVYTYTKDNAKDLSEGTIDRVTSYATQGGTYYAQSDINDIKVYGNYLIDGKLTGTNDTYYANVSQYTKLYDESGNDTLYVNDASASDLRLIFEITKDFVSINDVDEYTKDNIENSFQEVKLLTSVQRDLFLQDTDNNSGIGIDIDFWGDKAEYTDNPEYIATFNQYKGYFGGGIETIYDKDGKFITSDDIIAVAEDIAGWLKESEYGSVSDVFATDDASSKTALLAIFDNVNWHDAVAV